jgi:uroporphyrinogen decarboxylase
MITCQAEVDRDPWPDPDKGDYEALERFAGFLNPDMKFVVPGPGGLLENVLDLVGFERLCYMLFEDEVLAGKIFDAVGCRLVRFYEICASFACVGALIINDDWGFKTQTILDPDNLRRFVFPWVRKMVETIHSSGKPVILHSCGNIYGMLGEIIDDLKVDAKHSFEDVILPVEDAYRAWNHKIAILGGIDLDFLATASPTVINDRAGKLLELTGSKGYALGSGNSIPLFIPTENYMAMISAV